MDILPKRNKTGATRTGRLRKSRKRIFASSVPAIPPDFEYTDEFAGAFDEMEYSRHHLFITGNAGTGKSTLLQFFKENTKKNYVVVAPTGIAAINVGGSTIHSFFRFPTHFLTAEDVEPLPDKRFLFETLETVVVDEVSMVRADIMDAIDRSLRLNRGEPDEPFGGVQMILIGDLHQLPPVVETELQEYFHTRYETPFFFSSEACARVSLKKIELQRVFRQTDTEFIGLLNKIRNNSLTAEDLRFLNERYDPVGFEEDDMIITLTATNALASQINQSRLESLRGKEYAFDAEIVGTFDEKSFPTERRLKLKKGAQIMMLKNDPNKQYVNGSLGIIKKVSEDSIRVSFGDHICDIEPTVWEKNDYEYIPDGHGIAPVVVGGFQQYPIKLAWAITVHKSQGKTFESVAIDLGRGAFAHGQTYVALSRCRTLHGIHLRKPIRFSDVKFDERVIDF